MRELTQVSHLNHTHAQLGFATFMTQVYRYMSGGLILSALAAWVCAREPVLQYLYAIDAQAMTVKPTLLLYILMFSPLIILFPMQSAAKSNNPVRAQVWFWIFSAVMGISLSHIFLSFGMDLIMKAFLITGVMFGSCSLFGHNTKRDLSAIGRFCMMAVIGLIIAGLVNLFVQSSALGFATDIICILAFAGLTAYDTQRLNRMYTALEAQDKTTLASYSVMGAVALYLDFINLFLAILNILGSRRR